MTSEGVELEADPRHAELVVTELGLEGAKASLVPGSKEEVKKGDSFKDLGVAVDNVQKARDPAGGGNLEFEPNVDRDVDDDELLGPEDASLYRGVAARLNYIARDRPDLAYAVTGSASGMSAPKAPAMRILRNSGKY